MHCVQDVQSGSRTFSDDLLLSIPQLCSWTQENAVQCPGWTQSHCASAIVKPVAQVQMLAEILLLLVLLLL